MKTDQGFYRPDNLQDVTLTRIQSRTDQECHSDMKTTESNSRMSHKTRIQMTAIQGCDRQENSQVDQGCQRDKNVSVM